MSAIAPIALLLRAARMHAAAAQTRGVRQLQSIDVVAAR